MNKELTIRIPVAAGELIDKITILQLKASRLNRPEALANVKRELDELEKAKEAGGLALLSNSLVKLICELETINMQLWDVEDALRLHEAEERFDSQFIILARSVYQLNDHRSSLKRRINEACGSTLVEEKSYGECNKKPQS